MRHVKIYFWIFITLFVQLLAFKYAPVPFVFIFLTGTVLSFYLFTQSKISWIRILTWNLCLIFFLLLSIEGVLWIFFGINPKESQTHQSYTPGYFESNPVLGYAPKKDSKSYTSLIIGPSTIYDVTYTIDKYGFRLTNPSTDSDSPAILFFGCSFTFGEGLNDEQTMPWHVNLMTGGRFKVLNLGFHGYGPHQMLAALEHNLMDSALDGMVPEYVFYQCLPTHILRSAGFSQWDAHGPKYVLDKDEVVRCVGKFSDNLSFYESNVRRYYLLKNISSIGRMLPNRDMKPCYFDNLDLLVGTVKRSRELVKSKWPKARFIMILWPDENNTELYNMLRQRLIDNNFELLYINDILVDLSSTPQKYLIPLDDHPNEYANIAIAEEIVKRLR